MRRLLLYISALLALTSCQDLVAPLYTIDVSEAPDMAGNAVAFTAVTPSLQKATRAAFESPEAMSSALNQYKPTATENGYDYTFNISMFREGETQRLAGPTPYKLDKTEQNRTSQGILAPTFPNGQTTGNPLMWPDNVNRYGFSVVAGNNVVSSDQNNASQFYSNDRLEGYAFAPVFEVQDDLEALNYHTNKEWYTLNKTALGTGKSQDLYKAVPMYLKHKRAWVTIVLKAGTGIPREYLLYSKTDKGFEGNLYYYEGDNKKTVSKPWRRPFHVDYEDDRGQEHNTTMIHAIVEPTNYLANPEQLIGKITLNDMKFTYAPLNDANYSTYLANKDKTGAEYDALPDEVKRAIADMQVYNVEAGKHLVITATLSTDKVVLITARLEDWDEVSMTSICDDYGGMGKPEEIKTRDELLAFLQSAKNKPGTTALIVPTEMALDSSVVNKTWPNDLKLHCTLNLAGATISAQSQFLKEIDENGTLINGTIDIVGKRTDMEAAICSTNKGTIEQIKVQVGDDEKATTKEAKDALEALRKSVYATKGGLVGTNYGYILNCENNLTVKGTSGYLGGIAGESKRPNENSAPIIDNCVVNARVGTAGTDMNAIEGAGGIAGYAEGKVTRCSFNYGMTLLQQSNEKYKNIVQHTPEETGLKVEAVGNSWPTLELNEIGTSGNPNNNTLARYNAVLDSQEELKALLTNTAHSADGSSRYKIADNFEVNSSWDYGKNDDIQPGSGSTGGNNIGNEQQYNLNFELDGNGKTITTNGKMLFTNINGYFHDFTVYCKESVVSQTSGSSTEGMAPLAFSVNGPNARLAGIKMKMADGTYIQASIPSGLVVLAYGGAKIENCEIKADIRVKYHEEFSDADAWKYAGGIVACATDVTLTGCKVHSGTTIEAAALTDKMTQRNKQYRGGIVGGIVARSGYTPRTVIVDCNSWWGDVDTNEQGVKFSPAGSIIGASKYVNTQNQTLIGMPKGESSGNWWPEGTAPGYKAASDLNNTETTDHIGKKNSVTPDNNQSDF